MDLYKHFFKVFARPRDLDDLTNDKNANQAMLSAKYPAFLVPVPIKNEMARAVEDTQWSDSLCYCFIISALIPKDSDWLNCLYCILKKLCIFKLYNI